MRMNKDGISQTYQNEPGYMRMNHIMGARIKICYNESRNGLLT